ncbi:unnamed protein product [Adineta steineri]|uniref:Prolyl 4-hydroxylase alpha subunit domain-containing protein n=1 Tax=Adineta steineri TaxID=433720 RepID=A0A819S4N7_9BILA|nr:unnamed protein product [Adineta steineri]
MSNFCKEIPKISQDNNNYDLTQYKYECPHHRYTTRIIERSPLIVYIEQFLTQNEIQYLIELTEPFLKRSTVLASDGKYYINDNRTSRSAEIRRHQTPIVECIERRFAQFQGDIDVEHMEPLQVVEYTSGKQVKPHYDWFSQPEILKNGGQRVTSFFTYLEDNCSMGETEFLDIPFNKSSHERFCDILICDENSTEFGIRFRPLAGNSVFWYNTDEYGEVDYLTYHAGRPPGENGRKIGLNTWTHVDKFPLQTKI